MSEPMGRTAFPNLCIFDKQYILCTIGPVSIIFSFLRLVSTLTCNRINRPTRRGTLTFHTF